MHRLEYKIRDLTSLNEVLAFLSYAGNQMSISLYVDIGARFSEIDRNSKQRNITFNPPQSDPQLIQALMNITLFYEQNSWASDRVNVVHMSLNLHSKMIDKEIIRILATLFENGTYPPGFELDLSYCNLTDEDIRPLFTAMLNNYCKHPFALDLSRNKLQNLTLLSQVLASGAITKGTSIQLYSNKITRMGAHPFFNALYCELFPSNIGIDISRNLLDNGSLEDFSDALLNHHFPKHLELRLGSKRFDDNAFEWLMSSLCNSQCQALNLRLDLLHSTFIPTRIVAIYRAQVSGLLPANRCEISGFGGLTVDQYDDNLLLALQNVLTENNFSERLVVDINYQKNSIIGQLLCQFFKNSLNLKVVSLHLAGTKQNPDIYAVLISTISSNVSLRRIELDLSYNSLDLNVVPALIQLITRDAILERLSINLRGNPIKLEGIRLLCSVIDRPNIIDFSLSLAAIPNFSLNEVNEIALMIAKGGLPEKFTLDISGNNIDDAGIKLLMDALVESKCRTNLTLDLSNNKFTLIGAQHIARVLTNAECPANLTIFIRGNKFTRQGLLEIAQVYKSGKLPSGICLDFGYCNAYNPDVTIEDANTFYLAKKAYLADCGVKRILLQKHWIFSRAPDILERVMKFSNIVPLPIDNNVGLIIDVGRCVKEIKLLGEEQPQHVQHLLQQFQLASVSCVALDKHSDDLQQAILNFLGEEFSSEREQYKSSRVTEILYNKGLIDNLVVKDKNDGSKFMLSDEFFEKLQEDVPITFSSLGEGITR